MGVEQTHYVMYAVKMDYDWAEERAKDMGLEDGYSVIEDYEDGLNGVSAVYDGMNGNYVMLGCIVETGEDYEGLTMTAIPDCLSKKAQKAVREAVVKEFGIKDPDMKFYAFTHYS